MSRQTKLAFTVKKPLDYRLPTNEDSQSVTVPVPGMLQGLVTAIKKMQRGAGVQSEALDFRRKILNNLATESNDLGSKIPRGKALDYTLALTDDPAQRAGAYARHYAPHAAAGLGGLLAAYGLYKGLKKESADAFCKGFVDRAVLRGMSKAAAKAKLEEGLGPQTTISGTPGLPSSSQTTPPAMNVDGDASVRKIQDINQEDPSEQKLITTK